MPKTLLALAAVLSLTCACSRSRTFTTRDGAVSVDSSKQGESSVHVTGKDGTSMDLNTGKPITEYPADAPLYEGKAIVDIKAEGGRSVVVQTPDSIDKITGFYKTQLASKGWKTENTMTTETMNMFVATKEKQKLTVAINTDGKMQTISQKLDSK